MTELLRKKAASNKLLLAGISGAALYWLAESVIEVVAFGANSFVEQLFRIGVHEIWTRVLAGSLMIGFGAYAQRASHRMSQTELALRESEQYLRSLFENMLNGLAHCEIVTDDHGKLVDFVYLDVNEAFERMTGLKKEEVLGRKVTDVSPDIVNSETDLVGIYGRVALTGEPTTFELYLEPLERWLRVSACSPSTGHLLAVFEDISEQKYHEEKLSQHRAHLEELVEARTADLRHANQRLSGEIRTREQAQIELQDLYCREEQLRKDLEQQIQQRIDFTRVLVHELKTPLTPVLGASEMLTRVLDEGTALELARNICNGARNMKSRIDELLDLARGELGVLRLKCEAADVSELLRDVCESVGPYAETLDQSLHSDFPDSLPTAMVDTNRLRQVVLNLLNNAMEANPNGTEVVLAAHLQDSNIVIEVRDNGRGMDQAERERLFQPYYRLEEDRDRLSGLGLGLAVAKMLVELHGGHIWLETEKGEGSTFSFSVPLQPPADTTAQFELVEES